MPDDEKVSGRRALINIDKDTKLLVPLGAAAAFGWALWNFGGDWRELRLAVVDQGAKIERLETEKRVPFDDFDELKDRVWVAERDLEDLRTGRSVNVIPDPRSGERNSHGPGQVQDHQMQEVATTAADLAIADETAYTPEQAEAIISALETAEEKIRPLLPA